ncbi:MAG: pirin-like C-terminal cupin domain-containing protein [candidate division KSB1 bacterium]|nr:pirin-like C-terminal cupin domain-containing protein [candidate division KSB1 bacterium]
MISALDYLAGYFDSERDPYKFERQGENYFDFERDCRFAASTLVMYGDGDMIQVEAADHGVRFMLVSGAPLNEPVAWAGPIVMNTHQELRIAFDEFHAGTFVKQ